MRLKKLKVTNFKSLKNISFEPSDFTAIVGTNASGKTNFAKAIDFLSQVYKIGLERAILNAGGYENIALRKQRRSKAALEFEIVLEIDKKDLREGRSLIRHGIDITTLEISHKFALVAVGGGIKADFKVIHEDLKISNSEDIESKQTLLHVIRHESGKINLETVGDQIRKAYETLSI